MSTDTSSSTRAEASSNHDVVETNKPVGGPTTVNPPVGLLFAACLPAYVRGKMIEVIRDLGDAYTKAIADGQRFVGIKTGHNVKSYMPDKPKNTDTRGNVTYMGPDPDAPWPVDMTFFSTWKKTGEMPARSEFWCSPVGNAGTNFKQADLPPIGATPCQIPIAARANISRGKNRTSKEKTLARVADRRAAAPANDWKNHANSMSMREKRAYTETTGEPEHRRKPLPIARDSPTPGPSTSASNPARSSDQSLEGVLGLSNVALNPAGSTITVSDTVVSAKVSSTLATPKTPTKASLSNPPNASSSNKKRATLPTPPKSVKREPSSLKRKREGIEQTFPIDYLPKRRYAAVWDDMDIDDMLRRNNLGIFLSPELWALKDYIRERGIFCMEDTYETAQIVVIDPLLATDPKTLRAEWRAKGAKCAKPFLIVDRTWLDMCITAGHYCDPNDWTYRD